MNLTLRIIPISGMAAIRFAFAVAVLFFSLVASAQVNASFVTDKDGGCPPFTIQFTNTSTGASSGATYRWDFGNGNSSELKNPAAIFTEEKTYTVRLTVADAGKTATYTSQVTGFKKPVADFSVVHNKACIPATIQFVSNSTPGNGSIIDYYWDFGDGVTDRGYNPNMAHTYTQLLKPTVNLTVSNNFGCHATVEKREVVEVLPSMQASFTTSKQVLCKVTDAVQFNNTSSGPGTLSYTWNFGDGNTSTSTNPSYAFNKKGIYTVSLTVKNAEGCSVTNTQTDLLNVASYKASISAPALVCQGQPASFNATSNPYPASFNWYLDDQPAYSWYSNYTAYLNDTGKHVVKLVNSFGNCIDSASATIQVKPVPQLSGFVSDLQSFCGAPTVVKFKDTTAGAVKWDWKFTDSYYAPPTSTLQAPAYTYTSNGYYWVSLNVANVQGCSAAITKMVYITAPQVNIGNILPYDEQNEYCGYLKIQMGVSYATDSVASYKWNFGDGTTSTDAQPIHEFKQPGTYNVILEYTLKNGCKGAATGVSYTVYRKPVANFTVSPGTLICGNTPTRYTYSGGSAYTSIFWDLEGSYTDMSTGNYTAKQVQYQAEGVYGTKMTIYNGNCWDTLSRPQYVTVRLPFPRISSHELTCNGTRGLVKFNQNSDGANAIKWEFGDGQNQAFNNSEPSVEHEYTKTGSYKVALTATNGQCTVRDSIYINVLLKQKPTLAFNPLEICANAPTNYNASGYETNPAARGYDGYTIKKWEYSDGSDFEGAYTREIINYVWQTWVTNGKGTITSHQPKDKQIRLITTSSVFNCDDTTSYSAIRFKGAAAAFDVISNKPCFNTGEVVFRDGSTAPNNNITKWQWNFGDGHTQTMNVGGEVKHKYDNPGSYYVTLTITDAAGCSSSTLAYGRQVDVLGPHAAFVMSSGSNVPLNTTVVFYNNSNAYGVDNPVYEWDFGDGSAPSNDYTATHTFPQPGSYTIRLKATDPLTGCTSQTDQVLTVRYFNSAFQFTKSFITASRCAPAVAQFQNTSYDYTKIIWDFGDGSPRLEDVNYPSHVYKEPGLYEVVLFVYGYNGLKGQYKDTVDIKSPVAALAASPGEICIGQEVKFQSGGAGIAQYTWDMGDGVINISSDSQINYQYPTAGIYNPQLLVTDMFGCTQIAAAGDQVKVRPQPELTISPSGQRICLGEEVRIVAVATNAVRYQWKPTAGITQLNVADPIVKPAVSTGYEVTATDDIGCRVEGKTDIEVVQPEMLRVTADTGICFGQQAQLLASGTSRYTWINNTTGLSATDIPNPVATPSVNTVYTITGSDAYGCFPQTATVEVRVYDLPWVKAPSDKEIIAGTAVELKPENSPDVIRWNWTPGQYLDCAVCPAPTVTALGTTTYTLTVTNHNGCTASDDIKIKMQCDEAKVYIPNAFTPNGDGKNDVFNVLGISYVKHMVIYSRYGKKVFERRDFLAADKRLGWDGTLNGVPLQTDTYVYFVEMQCETGGLFTRKGTITMIR